MKKIYFAFCFIFLLACMACEKNDAPVLTGDINGKVILIDDYGFSLTDRSGVSVQLTGADTDLETITDANGNYSFTEVPYGGYHINLIRENFIEKNLNYTLGHAGGDAPTLTTQTMFKIPEYHYGIDSLTYDGISQLVVYMHTIGTTQEFANGSFLAHVFFSSSPEVAYDNYDFSFIEYVYEDAIYWRFWMGYYNFMDDLTGTVYCRVYPQAKCDGIWYDNTEGPHTILPETLGIPSEVFTFVAEDL